MPTAALRPAHVLLLEDRHARSEALLGEAVRLERLADDHRVAARAALAAAVDAVLEDIPPDHPRPPRESVVTVLRGPDERPSALSWPDDAGPPANPPTPGGMM